MRISRAHRRKALWIGPLLVALLVTGCAGIKPYEPRDTREEGPERGLFSGADGEFVIYRKTAETDPDGEAIENKNTGQKQP
jgi:hypothetical protein